MPDKAHILIVENEPSIAQELLFNLQSLGYIVIGMAYDSESALGMLSNKKPDIVLLDVNIKGGKDGLAIATIINEKYNIPFIFLTTHSDGEVMGRTKDIRPYGYIVKPFNNEDIKHSVAIALANYSMDYAKEEVSKEMLNKLCQTPLNDKEFQVILDIVAGSGTSDIANKNFISINTVKYHLKNIYQKLEVSDRTELLTKIGSD